MKRQILFIGSVVLTLAAGAIPFATAAEAAVVVRHHFVHRAATHHGGYVRAAHREYARRGSWIGGGWNGGDWVGDDGVIDDYYNGYGSYHGYAGDHCGTIQWTLDLCRAYSP